jgi:hypothetical protein
MVIIPNAIFVTDVNFLIPFLVVIDFCNDFIKSITNYYENCVAGEQRGKKMIKMKFSNSDLRIDSKAYLPRAVMSAHFFIVKISREPVRGLIVIIVFVGSQFGLTIK